MENIKLTSPCKDKRFISLGVSALVTVYSLLFILFNTLPAKPFNSLFERLEVVVGGFLLIAAVVKFITCKEERVYLKPRPFILIAVYLASRLIGWWSVGFDYSTIRTIFFEAVYLIAINEMIISKSFIRHRLAPMIILINLVLNILEAICHLASELSPGGGFSSFLMRHSYYDGVINFTYLYTNPNTMGIMTSLSLVLLLIIVPKPLSRWKLTLISIYSIFSFAVLFKSGCRSAQLALIVIILSYNIVRSIKPITGKRLTLIVLVASMLSTFAVYGFMYSHQNTGVAFEWENSYGSIEYKLNRASSARYNIWKTAMFAHMDKKAFGTGSLKNEMASRNAYIKGFWEQRYQGSYKFRPTILGPHSGYFAMIYTTGFVGFFIYISLLFYMICKADLTRRGNWYLAVIFTLVVSHLESVFIVSRFFLCLVMMMVLSAHDDDVDEEEINI